MSMSRRANGARWFASNSLKFRVGGVFVNGKMTVSLPEYMPDVEPEYILEVVPNGMPDVTSEHMPDVEPDVIGRTYLRLMCLKYLTVHCIS